jgi:hypothetical protein
VSTVEWRPTDDAVKGAWANIDDATRDGAYAFALAAAEAAIGHVAVRRAETKTGADYYLAPAGVEFDDLEKCLRFEVSGLDHATMVAIEYRLKNKLRQTEQGNSNLPALAGVVGFKEAVVLLAHIEA